MINNTENFLSHVVICKQLGEHTIKICELKYCKTKGLEKQSLDEDIRDFIGDKMYQGSIFDSFPDSDSNIDASEDSSSDFAKMDNSISRSKTKIKELVLCNQWDFWCTLTLDDSKQNRYDLDSFVARFGEFIHNYNRRTEEQYKVKYLLVPEKHKDGAWHMHGFIKGIRPDDLFTNQYGYLTWKKYQDKFGFISMSAVRDVDKASSYITKYITKDLSNTVTECNAHMYYHSKGLLKPKVIFKGYAKLESSWDWVHPDGLCKLKYIDTRQTDLSEVLHM